MDGRSPIVEFGAREPKPSCKLIDIANANYRFVGSFCVRQNGNRQWQIAHRDILQLRYMTVMPNANCTAIRISMNFRGCKHFRNWLHLVAAFKCSAIHFWVMNKLRRSHVSSWWISQLNELQTHRSMPTNCKLNHTAQDEQTPNESLSQVWMEDTNSSVNNKRLLDVDNIDNNDEQRMKMKSKDREKEYV